MLPGLGPKCFAEVFNGNETRVRVFWALIDFLAFLVQKSRTKINKLINYLISQIFLLTYIPHFEPETPAGHPKYEKTRIVA